MFSWLQLHMLPIFHHNTLNQIMESVFVQTVEFYSNKITTDNFFWHSKLNNDLSSHSTLHIQNFLLFLSPALSIV